MVIGTAGCVCCYRYQKDFRNFSGETLCLLIHNASEARGAAAFFDADMMSAETEQTDVTIPYVFNETYRRYNALQASFGTDLEDYCGKVCVQYRFCLQADDAEEGRTLTLLVYDGRLIGGDISGNAFDGTMRGLVS